MPIYIVRWPMFSVSLVKARDEDELQNMLDEVDDPGGCRWALYRGPLWIDMDLPVMVRDHESHQRPGVVPVDMQFEGIDELVDAEAIPYKVEIGSADEQWEMLEAVTKWAFPALHRARNASTDELPSHESITEALRRDMIELLQYTWRAAQTEKRTDFEGHILRQLGLTKAPPWLKEILRRKEQKSDPDSG